MADIKTELQRLYPPLPVCPPNHKFDSVAELYADYIQHLASRETVDPIGKRIFFLPENFPHLVKLEFFNAKTKSWTDALARPTIMQLESKCLDENRYRIGDQSRPRTLFWVPEVSQNT